MLPKAASLRSSSEPLQSFAAPSSTRLRAFAVRNLPQYTFLRRGPFLEHIKCKFDELTPVSKLKPHPKLSISADRSGNLYSFRGKRKLNLRKDGYLQISVGRSSFLAHRIVAECWIPNDQKKPKINHKNGLKTDNRIENLEWCTQLENVRHARDVLGVKYSVPRDQCQATKFFESHRIILRNLHELGFTLTDICKIMGFSRPTIKRNLESITCKKE